MGHHRIFCISTGDIAPGPPALSHNNPAILNLVLQIADQDFYQLDRSGYWWNKQYGPSQKKFEKRIG